MTTPLSEPQLAAWRGFLRAHMSLQDRLGAELEAEHGLPMTFYEVLVHLSEAPEGKLRMHELADDVMLSRSGLTRLLDRMCNVGLVERQRCPNDQRGALAAITPAGWSALRTAWPTHARGVHAYFADLLDPVELEEFLDVCNRIVAATGVQPRIPADTQCGGAEAEAESDAEAVRPRAARRAAG